MVENVHVTVEPTFHLFSAGDGSHKRTLSNRTRLGGKLLFDEEYGQCNQEKREQKQKHELWEKGENNQSDVVVTL